jgi:hypothetical protein
MKRKSIVYNGITTVTFTNTKITVVDKVIATGSDDGTINLSLESGAAIGVTIPIDEKDKTVC